jgi:hypothetical protein
MFIPDPKFFIPDPGSRVKKIPDPDPQQKIQVYLTHKSVTKLSQIGYEIFIPDLGSGIFHSGSRIRIQG